MAKYSWLDVLCGLCGQHPIFKDSDLENDLHHDRDPARLVRDVRAQLPEPGIRYVTRLQRAEVGKIERVHEIAANLPTDALFDHEILEDRNLPRVQGRAPDVGETGRECSKGKWRE